MEIMHEEEDYQQIDVKKPHLANLNQDPQLSRKVKYSIDQDEVKVGKRGHSPANDIEIGGMGIRGVHAIIKKIEDEYYPKINEMNQRHAELLEKKKSLNEFIDA